MPARVPHQALDRVPFTDEDKFEYHEVDLASLEFDESTLDAEFAAAPRPTAEQTRALRQAQARAVVQRQQPQGESAGQTGDRIGTGAPRDEPDPARASGAALLTGSAGKAVHPLLTGWWQEQAKRPATAELPEVRPPSRATPSARQSCELPAASAAGTPALNGVCEAWLRSRHPRDAC